MQVLSQPWRDWEPLSEKTSATIGVLDGVHRGHRRLIERLSPVGPKTVVTFDPHPIEVLAPGTPPRLLTTLEERIRLFDSVGVDVVAVLNLPEIRELAPEEFVSQVLVEKVNVGALAVGVDFRFGKDRAGDVDLLEAMSESGGYTFNAIDLVQSSGDAISSTRIRSLVEEGDVAHAADLLGSRFTLSNKVIDGDKRGRTIGFPTANLMPPDRKVIPANGVYAAMATVQGVTHLAAVNVGVRPTFGEGVRLVEAFLIDFDDDIYGEELRIEFVERLRPELKFDSVEELVDRMHEDVAASRKLLESLDPVVG